MESFKDMSDGKKKPHREILNISIGEFFQPSEYFEPSSEELASWREQDLSREQKKKEMEDKFGYRPFEPLLDLKTIRHLSDEEKKLPQVEQRKIVRANLDKYKNLLRKQKIGIAATIQELYERIENSPDSPEDALKSMVTINASVYKFGGEILHNFDTAITLYQARHKVVEMYRNRYLSDQRFFEICFGAEPKGRVEVIKGSMTLSFRCFNEDDYIWAYSFYKTNGDKTILLDKETIDTARLSGGAALFDCAISELRDTIIIENASINKKVERGIVQKEELLYGGEAITFLLKNQRVITIEIENFGTYHFKILEKDKDGNPTRIQFLEEGKILRDIAIVTPVIFSRGGIRDFDDTSASLVSTIEETLVVRNGRGESSGSILVEVSPSFIKLDSKTRHLAAVIYQEDEDTEIIADKRRSEQIMTHEKQHQINKLFWPNEFYSFHGAILEEAVHQKTAEDVINSLIYGLVRFERKFMGIDSSARDEILAYYKDGRGTEFIYNILATSKLYDYKNNEYYKNKIDKIADHVITVGKENMTDAIWGDEFDGGELVGVKELVLDRGEIGKTIDKVFDEEYKQDLEKWISAVTILEQKGYARQEIVSMFYQEPVNHWIKLAERAAARALTSL